MTTRAKDPWEVTDEDVDACGLHGYPTAAVDALVHRLRTRLAWSDMLLALDRIAHGLEADGRTADGITKADAAAMAREAIAKATGADE